MGKWLLNFAPHTEALLIKCKGFAPSSVKNLALLTVVLSRITCGTTASRLRSSPYLGSAPQPLIQGFDIKINENKGQYPAYSHVLPGKMGKWLPIFPPHTGDAVYQVQGFWATSVKNLALLITALSYIPCGAMLLRLRSSPYLNPPPSTKFTIA